MVLKRLSKKKKGKLELRDLNLQHMALTFKPAAVSKDDDSEELGSIFYVTKSDIQEEDIRMVTKGLLEEFNVSDSIADIDVIAERESWEKAWVNFRKKYDAAIFQPYWEEAGEYESNHRYWISNAEDNERVFTIELFDEREMSLGISFWMGISSKGKSYVRAISFKATKFNFDQAQQWVNSHKIVSKGGETDMVDIKEIENLFTEHLKPVKALEEKFSGMEAQVKELVSKSAAPPPETQAPTPTSEQQAASPENQQQQTPVDLASFQDIVQKSFAPLSEILKEQQKSIDALKGTTQAPAGEGTPAPAATPADTMLPFHAEVQKCLHDGYTVVPVNQKIHDNTHWNEAHFQIKPPAGMQSGAGNITAQDLANALMNLRGGAN